jgi:DNA-binding transcriptional LysR family regulator
MDTSGADRRLLGRDRQAMELHQIRCFMAVAEEGHLGRAAQRMSIAQPALSQGLRRLERELGTALFDRPAHQAGLTPEGEAFLQVARRVSRRADDKAGAARPCEMGAPGSLGLGVHLPMAAPVLSVLLGHWSRLRPAVPPRLTSGKPDELVDLVRRRELDVALVDGPVTDRGLRSSLVFEDQLVIVLPTDHWLARDETVAFASLQGERFVTVSRRSSISLHERFIELGEAAGFRPDIALEVDDPDLLPMAVAGGLGVGLAASVTVTGRALPGLVWRPVADPGATVPVVAVAADNGVSTQAQDFLQLVDTLRRGSRLLPLTTVDLTEPPNGEPAGAPVLCRALQRVG